MRQYDVRDIYNTDVIVVLLKYRNYLFVCNEVVCGLNPPHPRLPPLHALKTIVDVPFFFCRIMIISEKRLQKMVL